jgi:predicted molibdopterin-dependent oxidoreductase YjgC
MFQRINPATATLRLTFNGTEIVAAEGESVATALLAAGISSVRDSPVGNAPRGPYCLTGVCFECLVEIDGMPNRQACMTPARNGMVIRRQRGARNFA